jgi:GNAT superfamily N-acetyltransferase
MSTSVERSLDLRASSLGARASALRGKLQSKLDQVRARGIGAVIFKAFKDHIYGTRELVILEKFPETGRSGRDPLKQGDVVVVQPGDPLPDMSRYFSASQIAGCQGTIRAGCTGFFALKDGHVVGFGFAALSDYYETQYHRWFRVRDAEAYTFNWLVVSDQRSFALASRLEKACAAYLARRGCRRLYCVVETWNTSSLGTLLFLGYQESGEFVTLRRLLRGSWSTRKTGQEPRFARYQRKHGGRRQASA